MTNGMSLRTRAAFGCYLVFAVLFGLGGIVYATASEIMPYHQQVTGMAWAELEPGVRTLLGVYEAVDDASETVSAIIRAGIVPAAMELIDNLAIRAVEAHLGVGFPEDAAAVLLIDWRQAWRWKGTLVPRPPAISITRETPHQKPASPLWLGGATSTFPMERT